MTIRVRALMEEQVRLTQSRMVLASADGTVGGPNIEEVLRSFWKQAFNEGVRTARLHIEHLEEELKL